MGKKLSDINIVINGAGAAGIACLELLKSMGLPNESGILCDTKGVIHADRKENINQWKSAHAIKTKKRTLRDALKGADVFLGLSSKSILTKKDHLFIGNSSPIRSFNKFTGKLKNEIQTFTNRGASGIDGIISTALGISFINDKNIKTYRRCYQSHFNCN